MNVFLEERPRAGVRRGAAWLFAVAVIVAPAMALAEPRGVVDPGTGLAGVVAALERELAADVVRDSIGSVAAAVFIDDDVVWRGAFGWRDRGSRSLASSGTLYRAGSVSKIVTALVLLRLVDEGALSLDDRVATHLPEIADLGAAVEDAPGLRITYRQLAMHTAGLAREPDRGVHARGPFREWKRKAVAAVPETRLVAEPGSGYGYSNIGYGLLGVALERAAGRPFEVLADSLVFRPLGMRSTSYSPGARQRRLLATGYVNLPGDTADPRVPRVEHRGRGYRVPSGGVYSTVHDLARLGMAVTGAMPLLSDSLREAMLDPVGRVGEGPAIGAEAGGAGGGYGIGLQLMEIAGASFAGHSGTVPGYAAYLLVDVERRTGVVLLRNYNNGETNLGAVASRLLLDLREGGM